MSRHTPPSATARKLLAGFSAGAMALVFSLGGTAQADNDGKKELPSVSAGDEHRARPTEAAAPPTTAAPPVTTPADLPLASPTVEVLGVQFERGALAATGAGIGVLVMAGLGLVGLGAALRRGARRR